jgi:alpha-L-rhamnosidase
LAEAPRPTHLRAEHLVIPLGIGTARPRLSWWLPDGAARQEACQVRAATDAGTHGDTGWVASEQSVLAPWGGPPLHSGQRVTWQVRVRTDQGESDWSETAWVEAGLLEPGDWTAQWVSPAEPDRAPAGQRPAMLLRGEFDLPGPVTRARLYATAHGIYEAFLNGRRVGDAELTPGYTAYGQRLQVQAYDITALLRPGRNALGAIVSDGWFRGQVGLPRSHDQWGTDLAFLAQVQATLADGSTVTAGTGTAGTGPAWRSARSHITAADLIAGQSADLRHYQDGWDEPGFDDAAWDPAGRPGLGYDRLVASPAPPVRRAAELPAVAVRPVPGGQVFDLGQNISGWARLRDLGPAGTTLTLTHGEATGPDGDVTTAHLDVRMPFLPAPLPAGQVDRVISAGRPGQAFEPRHTTHGFRYVRVAGHPRPLAAADLTGVAVHTDLSRTGWFACSDERVSRLHEAAVWSLRGNACDIPTDCPTRERAGWTGDWQAFVPAAAFAFDVAGFSVKWLRDLAAEQWPGGLVANLAPSPPAESAGSPLAWLNGSAGWGDAAVIVPWEIYRAYGDAGLLDEQWPSMTAWLGYVEQAAASGRHPGRAARYPVPRPHERYLWDTGFHFGEWLEPGADLGPAGLDALRRADHGAVATAYFARSAGLLSRIAAVTGRPAEAARYRDLAGRVRAAWQAEFARADGRLDPDTQATYARALAFGLLPEASRAAAASRLVALIRAGGSRLGTGFLSTPLLLPALADAGYLDVAYDLLLADTIPSWLYMIDQGATTLWERWDGMGADGVPHGSLNHYARGAVITFLHRYVAGIALLDDFPGYRRFRVQPRPGGGITWARARHDSPYGRIESAWEAGPGGLRLSVTVPPGTTAEVVLPDGSRRDAAPGRHEFRLPSGGTA